MKMNRRQRRDMMARLRTQSRMTKTEAKAMVEAFVGQQSKPNGSGPLMPGTKAKINLPLLMKDPSWELTTKEEKAWIEMNKDEILTVGYNSLYSDSQWRDPQGRGSLISFREDDQKPPIVFFSSFIEEVTISKKSNKIDVVMPE